MKINVYMCTHALYAKIVQIITIKHHGDNISEYCLVFIGIVLLF